MILIDNKVMSADDLKRDYAPDSIEWIIIDRLSSSSEKYYYSSLDEFKFELRLRNEIIAAARALNRSGMDFEVFRDSRCNHDYWNRTREGGFVLKNGVKPSDAIEDIFKNGSKYGTECATAMMIVYYKALLSVYSEDRFNQLFPKIELMDWHHIDRRLQEVGNMTRSKDYLPGDRRYFANPDVSPVTPEWQGENVIDLGDGTYYGHGIGIYKADAIIKALNRHRTEDADETAHLLDSAGRPNFKRLYSYQNQS